MRPAMLGGDKKGTWREKGACVRGLVIEMVTVKWRLHGVWGGRLRITNA